MGHRNNMRAISEVKMFIGAFSKALALTFLPPLKMPALKYPASQSACAQIYASLDSPHLLAINNDSSLNKKIAPPHSHIFYSMMSAGKKHDQHFENLHRSLNIGF